MCNSINGKEIIPSHFILEDAPILHPFPALELPFSIA